ncbi:multicopper oxidase [Hydnum rufescens UP504]|uniref:Multicopper oxidase n=1 Tax=Hydnum rufescens UP504 TaxID=1448309 RepID=A0A9P6DVI4_9AGAM|nr:multicopper oxidase [Hydnum rufescens UP504]
MPLRRSHLNAALAFATLCAFIFPTSIHATVPIHRGTPSRSAPATKVTNNRAIYTLSPTFVITDVPVTRTFDWTLSLATGAPDGVEREMMVINGQFPGPLIEANQGDTIIVNVRNGMTTGAGIHWHGIAQKGTDWADGVPGVSQCPIPAGSTFTYKLTVANQFGTFWWHSHMGNTMADGLLGPLIIHSPNDPNVRGRDYESERIIILGDWMHDMSDVIIADLLTVDGYRNSTGAPVPDALLINGVGVYNCSSVTNTSCTTQPLPEIDVVPNSSYRIRIINTMHYKFSIDSHPLKITAADDTAISGPKALHQLPIGIGQRYDAIIKTTVGTHGSAYYVRAAMCAASIANVPSNYDITALAVLRYVATGSKATTTLPSSTDWSDSVNNDTTCYDLDTTGTSVFGFITNSALESIAHFFWNSVTWTNYIYKPMLFTLKNGGSLNSSIITHAIFPSTGAADIIINNHDGGIDHPYHLHGNAFYLVSRGSGLLTATEYAARNTSSFNTTNPLRRDTLVISRSSYAIIRIITDNPGVWPLHCHIGWHLGVGKMATIVVQPAAIRNLSVPAAATALCDASNIPAGDTVNTTAPGRKRRSTGADLTAYVLRGLNNAIEHRRAIKLLD